MSKTFVIAAIVANVAAGLTFNVLAPLNFAIAGFILGCALTEWALANRSRT